MMYVEILIATIGAFLLGFLWYTALFGKVWQQETGVTDEQAQSGIAITHGLAFLMMFIILFGVNFVIDLHKPEDQTAMHGAFHGVLSAAMFCVPAVAINYLYQKKSLKLFLIDAGYVLAFTAVGGAILAILNLK